jgi:mono/diheme cytochrome c family protein
MTRGTTRATFRAGRHVLVLAAVALGTAWSFSYVVWAAPQWQIPGAAIGEHSPVRPDDAVLKRGRALFADACARCHGPQGKGNGPEGDPDHPPGNLTDPTRAADNPDGVMFYKIWNGRKAPSMPAFKSQMTKDDVWTVIAYVKTLRAAPAE